MPRRKPYGKPSRRGQIAGKRSIDERPAEANERTRLGDWEGDTVVGKGHHGYLLTCVDRLSRYLIARKLNACATEPVAQQLQQTIRRSPAEYTGSDRPRLQPNANCTLRAANTLSYRSRGETRAGAAAEPSHRSLFPASTESMSRSSRR